MIRNHIELFVSSCLHFSRHLNYVYYAIDSTEMYGKFISLNGFQYNCDEGANYTRKECSNEKFDAKSQLNLLLRIYYSYDCIHVFFQEDSKNKL